MKGWGVKIIGFGAHLPGEPLTNEDLKSRFSFEFDADKHAAVTGIKQRHWADKKFATSHIAAEAAKQALERAGIKASQLSRIILGTQTPDYVNTAASCNVQQLIGATCPVGDTTASCASFMYALDFGIRLVATGMEYVLVIGADLKSRSVRRNDPIFLPIFSDGAGAVLLTKCKPDEGFLDIQLWADGSGIEKLYVPAGGSAMPSSHETVDADLHGTVMKMTGRELAESAAGKMSELAKQVCDNCGITIDEIDVFVPHQANYYIMKKTAESLQLPLYKMEVSIDRVGNCIAGTIPITFNQAFENDKLKPGAMVLLTAAGAGYTGGAAIYKVPA
ncbi:MAG TPA: 3-oxoacyl-ACP synthase III family protein [Parafilimonas sp.]|jgi:3-oxoacyl-[acyl-carrier-protein] synthase-3